ncbi:MULTISPECIES: HlyD family secretion protein [Pseudomonadati]|uniref:HlyD family efflux transporter periplasmic adaptor subunit n=1 Tax=Shewanella aestuarii TaxID=1028752 RepID=A0ABT0L410_9GAMM|nr:HlyD family efflux transporter periplasmic adaptor subunit [Shewanella aestuarii]MCL1118433.1 HlyD family efflux transporter periplasmic adaptor subunit [Shewanella aestuarii]GGN82497.1 membrane protein [Shewanella aestuarii]
MKRIVLSLLVMGLLSACKPSAPHQAIGTLERDRVTFTATANEIIRELPVIEGSLVEAGQVLVKLDTQNQQAILARAIANESKATAYLQKLTNGERVEDIAASQAKVAQAEAQFIESQKHYRRQVELVERKIVSQSELDSAIASRDKAQASLNAAKEEFSKLTAGSRVEDIEQAKAELAASRAEVALQTQKLAELTIVATRDGILDNLPYNLGERVAVNSIVAVMLANSVPYARVYVPANHRIHFTPGRKVMVHVDGVEQAIEGKVRWVSHEASFTPYFALTENERARLMYLAEVDLVDTAAQYPSGVPAQVDIVESSGE